MQKYRILQSDTHGGLQNKVNKAMEHGAKVAGSLVIHNYSHNTIFYQTVYWDLKTEIDHTAFKIYKGEE